MKRQKHNRNVVSGQLVILHVVVNYAYLSMDYYVFMDGCCIFSMYQLLPPNYLQLR